MNTFLDVDLLLGSIAENSDDRSWIPLTIIYIVILCWITFISVVFSKIAKGKDSQGPPSSKTMEQLSKMDDTCFVSWQMPSNRQWEPERTAKYRLGFCIYGIVLTLGNIIFKVWKTSSLFKGFATHFAMMTNWGILLNTVYHGAAYLYFKVGKVDLGSRRILCLLCTLGLCLEVTICVMWFLCILDVTVPHHVFAPALMVLEFKFNRLPIFTRDVLALLLMMAVYLVVNY